jgi:hypothetical protein
MVFKIPIVAINFNIQEFYFLAVTILFGCSPDNKIGNAVAILFFFGRCHSFAVAYSYSL